VDLVVVAVLARLEQELLGKVMPVVQAMVVLALIHTNVEVAAVLVPQVKPLM